MIIGIAGTICSGKETFAEYLVKEYSFEAVNIIEIFRQKLRQLKAEERQEKGEEPSGVN